MKPQINLYNPQLGLHREFFSFCTLMLGIGIVCLLGALGYAWYGWQVSDKGRQSRELDARLQTMRDETLALSKALAERGKNPELEMRRQQLEARLARMEAVGRALAQADGEVAAGFSEIMRAFARQSMPGVWLTGLTVAVEGAEMRIDGRALNPDLVPAYIARLNNEPLLQGRSFAQFAVSQAAAATPGAVPAQAPAPGYHEFRLLSSLANGVPGKGGPQ